MSTLAAADLRYEEPCLRYECYTGIIMPKESLYWHTGVMWRKIT